MLKNIHEVIFSLAVILGQVNKGKVFLLLDKIVLKADVPAERIPERHQKSSITFGLDKARGL